LATTTNTATTTHNNLFNTLDLPFMLDNRWGIRGKPVGGAALVWVLFFVMRLPSHLNGSATAAPEHAAAVVPAAGITKQRCWNIILGAECLSHADTIDQRIDNKGESDEGNPEVED
jgi:hypothetical protein